MKEIIVSDHAVIRWLERAHGVDIDFFRTAIGARCGPAIQAGASALILPDGQFTFRGNIVTTFLSAEMRRQGRQSLWRRG